MSFDGDGEILARREVTPRLGDGARSGVAVVLNDGALCCGVDRFFGVTPSRALVGFRCSDAACRGDPWKGDAYVRSTIDGSTLSA